MYLRYSAAMTNGRKIITAECCTLGLMEQWVADNEKLGFKLIGEIDKVYY